ncbi:MAG: outer membrane lipoprotein-sorting protein [Nitrospirota bacterium]|jgi:hypothetical protein
MTTLPVLWGLLFSLVLSGSPGSAAASGTDPLGSAAVRASSDSIDSASVPPQPVLMAWDFRRFFGGSKKEEKPEEEKQPEEGKRPEEGKKPAESKPPEEGKKVAPPSAAPKVPPREVIPAPAPPPPPPLAPPPTPSVKPPPKAAAPKPAPALPPPKVPATQRPAPERPKPKPAAPATRAPAPSAPPAAAVAPPPEAITAEALARRVYDRDTGDDSTATVEMVLTSRSGHTRVRRFDSKMRRHDGLQDSLIRFTYPADIEDTAFLTLERTGDDAEQFLYLPALRRVRRIVAKQKGKSFVNSDLYYQDLERRSPDKDAHRIVGEERIGAWQCWILESIPKEEDSSAYGKTLAWIDQSTLVPMRVDSFDHGQNRIKSTMVHRLEQVDGIWTVLDSEVTSLESEHTTRLTVQEIRYNTGLSPNEFSKRALRK